MPLVPLWFKKLCAAFVQGLILSTSAGPLTDQVYSILQYFCSLDSQFGQDLPIGC
jgi:hypothetical protein